LVYNPLDNEPQFDSDAQRNYYLQNITTGQQQLLVDNHSADGNKIVISNAGNYVAYFKEGNWWLYDIAVGQHRELTSQTGNTFINEKYDRSGEKSVPGIMGWTANEKELLVYDTYDIWQLKTDGSSAVRLTKGREKGIVFRLVSKSPYGATDSASNGILDLDNGLMLQAVGASKSGYFTWDNSKGPREIVFENKRIGSLKHSADGTYVYLREHYHLPPQLVYQFRNSKPKVVYQSNPQQKNYAWGFSRLISYENSKGQQLNGALFYPAGYDADKSYPMVVNIYERLSDYYNQYVNPTLLNAEGFNISNLTTQGYFVLLPDIVYEEGETGSSAVDCVTAAVDEVLKNESIDSKRVGLFGHSFGGYETNFIVTQTDLFAAAVSGAGFSDSVSSYLTVGRSNMKQDSWRYEYSQLRMGISLFDGFDSYLQNSPVTFADQITTPLLIWAGMEDGTVDYRQSLELHLALRRLQKPNILLLYERGGHSIMRSEDQIDLSYRMQQWWDYYLKGGVKPEWLTPDKI
jgi:dipeptidyl aminopeptidase/acylaminoacyl peptidase